eukprot:TRINITY_DN13804_c0_g1_i1.p1 TRINITY_DN13804_c0_g1~~TRINITY_DN13804_c0_g1_i1.p1  ORF type:complete len:1057 (+),score=278.04 TRINITY_DN13804_c0_g1_i1:201-3173(+)
MIHPIIKDTSALVLPFSMGFLNSFLRLNTHDFISDYYDISIGYSIGKPIFLNINCKDKDLIDMLKVNSFKIPEIPIFRKEEKAVSSFSLVDMNQIIFIIIPFLSLLPFITFFSSKMPLLLIPEPIFNIIRQFPFLIANKQRKIIGISDKLLNSIKASGTNCILTNEDVFRQKKIEDLFPFFNRTSFISNEMDTLNNTGTTCVDEKSIKAITIRTKFCCFDSDSRNQTYEDNEKNLESDSKRVYSIIKHSAGFELPPHYYMFQSIFFKSIDNEEGFDLWVFKDVDEDFKRVFSLMDTHNGFFEIKLEKLLSLLEKLSFSCSDLLWRYRTEVFGLVTPSRVEMRKKFVKYGKNEDDLLHFLNDLFPKLRCVNDEKNNNHLTGSTTINDQNSNLNLINDMILVNSNTTTSTSISNILTDHSNLDEGQLNNELDDGFETMHDNKTKNPDEIEETLNPLMNDDIDNMVHKLVDDLFHVEKNSTKKEQINLDNEQNNNYESNISALTELNTNMTDLKEIQSLETLGGDVFVIDRDLQDKRLKDAYNTLNKDLKLYFSIFERFINLTHSKMKSWKIYQQFLSSSLYMTRTIATFDLLYCLIKLIKELSDNNVEFFIKLNYKRLTLNKNHSYGYIINKIPSQYRWYPIGNSNEINLFQYMKLQLTVLKTWYLVQFQKYKYYYKSEKLDIYIKLDILNYRKMVYSEEFDELSNEIVYGDSIIDDVKIPSDKLVGIQYHGFINREHISYLNLEQVRNLLYKDFYSRWIFSNFYHSTRKIRGKVSIVSLQTDTKCLIPVAYLPLANQKYTVNEYISEDNPSLLSFSSANIKQIKQVETTKDIHINLNKQLISSNVFDYVLLILKNLDVSYSLNSSERYSNQIEFCFFRSKKDYHNIQFLEKTNGKNFIGIIHPSLKVHHLPLNIKSLFRCFLEIPFSFSDVRTAIFSIFCPKKSQKDLDGNFFDSLTNVALLLMPSTELSIIEEENDMVQSTILSDLDFVY